MYLIVRLIAKYALWIYIACGVGMIIYLQIALLARKEGIFAIFTLERTQAAKRIYRSSWMILVLLLIVVGVYALSNYIELPPPTVPITETVTPTAETTPTIRPLPSPSFVEGTPALTPSSTATRRPPNVTLTASVPASTRQTATPVPPTAPAGCPLNVQVSQPALNQIINAGIQARGTANKENFDRYEFKFKNLDIADEWHWVETFTTPVESGDLGFWNTAHLPDGNYRFMLIVIDTKGNSEECTIPVKIKH